MAHIKKTALILGTLVLALSTLFLSCSNEEKSGEQAQTEKKDIRLGYFNWAENVAVTNMWKILLEEKGYDVEIVSGDKSPIWTGVAEGDLDVHFEAWMPKSDKPMWDEYKDSIEKYGPWFEGTQIGLAVPSYMDIDSIDELNAHRDQFTADGNAQIVGIDSGSMLMEMSRKAVEEYGLDYELISSSGPVMAAELTKGIENDRPVVVTLWKPHWLFAEVDVKFLEDPKNVYGKIENIHFIGHKDFHETHPKVLSWMQNWKLNDATLGSLMSTIKKADSPEEGAQKWIDANRDLVNSWFEES